MQSEFERSKWRGLDANRRFTESSYQTFDVKITETIMPGKNGKGKFLFGNGPLQDYIDAGSSYLQPFDSGETEISIIDYASCNCLILGEHAKVYWDQNVGSFVPVGSRGLIRQAKATENISEDSQGDGELLANGESYPVPVTAEFDNGFGAGDIQNGDKFWACWVLGQEAKSAYSVGKWNIIVAPNSKRKFVKGPDGGISGRIGLIPGVGTCDVWGLDENGMLVSKGETITVINWAVSPVFSNGNRFGWVDYYDGAYWVVSEDCNDEGTAATSSMSMTEGGAGEYSTEGSATSNITFSWSYAFFDSDGFEGSSGIA